uniref:Reverse transcriptase domain-containing protein n=1 Tax=Tanacetum cinerariifolium TaxID=118510 RepID=A0A6L2NJ75_TANCI|nr:reverse transcriptase domain-containing protein [Tanacetum cinerariifolium]
MADACTMSELLQAPTKGYKDAIVLPSILAENFELKVGLLSLVTLSQFHGFETDDLNSHICWFNKITSTLKYKNITNLKNEIINFQQRFDETFSEAYDRFKDLLRKCPHHGFLELHQIATFYNALTQSDQDYLNAATGVSTTTSSPSPSPNVTALIEIVKELVLMNKANQQALVKAMEEICVTCGGPHPYYECLATDGNTFDAFVVIWTYNQGGNGYHPQGDPNYHASNQMGPPGFPPLNFQNIQNYNQNQYNQNQGNYLAPNNQGFNQQKRLPEKLRDPGRFLIPCDFHGLESCMALSDLGASINLMPLSIWKKLSLPDLTPTCMTLKLATRSIAYPAGIAEDVFVQVGKFRFPADFVVIDYDIDLCVPLIFGIPFLRTAHALVNVQREELILRDGNEKLIFHANITSKHPYKHDNKSIKMINFIDITCEDRFPEVSKIKKSNHPSSGSSTPLSDSSLSLIPFETSDSLLEEFINELTLFDPFSPGNEDDNFDLEADIRINKYLLNQDPSTKSEINIIDPILVKVIDEPVLDYSPPPGDDDDDLFDFKSDNDEWKKILYGDCFKDIDSEKIKTRILK